MSCHDRPFLFENNKQLQVLSLIENKIQRLTTIVYST